MSAYDTKGKNDIYSLHGHILKRQGSLSHEKVNKSLKLFTIKIGNLIKIYFNRKLNFVATLTKNMPLWP